MANLFSSLLQRSVTSDGKQNRVYDPSSYSKCNRYVLPLEKKKGFSVASPDAAEPVYLEVIVDKISVVHDSVQ